MPCVYVRSGDVRNGLVYLILSSATRVDAVWRALRRFKDGEILLLRPLVQDRHVRKKENFINTQHTQERHLVTCERLAHRLLR